MQAGRVLSQARWANPRRKPVKRRSSARIAEAALCGVPARPSGAVSPQKERTSRDREAKGREGVDLRSRSEGAGAPPPAGLTCVRPWRRRLARRRPLACCCHQLPMDPQLPALHCRLFSPLHKNNEKSVQVVAAMVCPKCKISLPPPYLDDSPVGIFNSSYFSLLFLKRSLLDFGCTLGKAREGRLEQGRQLHKRKQRRQEQQDRTPPQETRSMVSLPSISHDSISLHWILDAWQFSVFR